MKWKVLRALGALTVALIFLLTLATHWPLAGLAGVLQRPEVKLAGVSGTLTDGAVSDIAFTANGWPLSLGPLQWQLTWPLGIFVQLGNAPTAWKIKGDWHGDNSQWMITGGDMAALDLSRLPFAIEARWEGALNLTLADGQCAASEGALTAAHIDLLSPTPISLGHGRLHLDCSAAEPHLLLEIDDGEALSVTVSLALAASGSGQVQGIIAPSHPLEEWRQLLQPGTRGAHIDAHFRW